MSTIDTTPHDQHGDHHGDEHHGSYLDTRGRPLFSIIWDWMTTVDHKKIGMMYLVAVLTMFLLGGIAALMVRTELLDPVRLVETTVDGVTTTTVEGQLFNFLDKENVNKGNEIYNRIFTLHGAIMVFMFIVPSVPASLGNFLIPLMIGAKDVA
ncbi:MAG: cbb3-type cytochrome c oxidase subunit I, partial [Phycisphaerales bacterium]|nr:cbb3-type cytochrome c oxidase subunit I [Phycisphaerales bacterium]